MRFVLGEERYGIDIGVIDEILTYPPVTFVPRAPAYVRGITSLRGRIVPVLDLRIRLGRPPKEPDLDSRVLIIKTSAEPVGLLVDGVLGVGTVDRSGVEPPPATLSAASAGFVAGIARQGPDSLLILLQAARVLARDEEAE